MDTIDHEDGAPYSVPRRSQRVEVSIAVTLIGKDASGREFRENTRTVVVNKHGAKVATTHRLALGAEVTLENRKLGKKARGKVAWLGESLSARDPLQVGIQLYEAENIWGIEFPPEDWQDIARKAYVQKESPPPEPLATPPLTSGQEPQATGHPAAGAETQSNMSASEISFSLREAIEAAAIDFEKRLAAIAARIGAHAGTNMAAAAEGYQQKLQNSFDELMRSASEKLDAASQNLDALLKKAEDAKESSLREAEKAHSEVRAATADALETALDDFTGRISKDMESRQADLAASVSDQISRTSVEQVTKAIEERVARLVPEVESQISGRVHDGLKADIEQTMAHAREQFDISAKDAASGLDRAMSDRKQAFATEANEQAEQLSASAMERVRREIDALVQEAGAQAREHLNKLTATSLEESISEAKRKIAQAADEILAAKQSGVKESMIEDVRRRLVSLSKGTAEAMNKEAVAGLDRYQAELRKLWENEFAGATGRLKKASQDAIVEATELFRSSIAGVFSSLSPGGKKSATKESG